MSVMYDINLICQDRQLVHLTNVVYWRNLEVRPGGPLQWLALSPHVLGRVPELPRVIQVAQHHAASAKVSTWAAARGFNAWGLSCVIARLFK